MRSNRSIINFQIPTCAETERGMDYFSMSKRKMWIVGICVEFLQPVKRTPQWHAISHIRFLLIYRSFKISSKMLSICISYSNDPKNVNICMYVNFFLINFIVIKKVCIKWCYKWFKINEEIPMNSSKIDGWQLWIVPKLLTSLSLGNC